MKTRDVRRLIKMLMPAEAHAVLDLAANAREIEKVLETWNAARTFGGRLKEERAATAPAAPEPTETASRPLYLHRVGSNKIGVIKAVREITGLGLKGSKDLTDAAETQSVCVGRFSGDDMTKALRTLIIAGATASL